MLDAADAPAPQATRARINTMLDFCVRKAIQLIKANVCERISPIEKLWTSHTELIKAHRVAVAKHGRRRERIFSGTRRRK
ncbi:hypothetical protein [Mesorhizobium sp. AA23]|uniref:hypothetical protein n=1 Tax=Mesorhizobium sp. AA23 TaxID=1854058 RepID=UPI0007FEEE20|nr:hypothetical protein [Mesorhizobium sp. AA23]OBQ90127.1 hypothetical protein A9K66_15980 [Mesorhizobium sp. AA23]